MIKKILLGLTALSVLLAMAAVTVFSAAYALFALLSEYLGPAGAAGLVALGAAAIVVIGVLIAALKFRSPGHKPGHESDSGLTGRLFALAREKPILTAGAAAAVAAIAFRNPKLVTALLTGILAGKASPKN